MPFCPEQQLSAPHPLPDSLHTALCQSAAEAQVSIPPRFPLSSPWNVWNAIKELASSSKSSTLKSSTFCCCLAPPTRASSPFNLAGVWQSKVNKCEMGHVFSIVSLCHTCSPLSMINIPPTSGLPFLGAPWASRRLACQNTPWPPGITERSKPTLPVHLKSIEPIRSPHKWRMTRFWHLYFYWKTLCFLMDCLLVLDRQR